MECPICYTEYDNENHAPLVTFCCQNTLCMKCVKSISAERSTSSCCPWDKRRWVGRSVLNNIMNSTPPNYFETLRKRKQDSSNHLEMESNMRELGSGALREEYEDRMRRERERFELEHREQLLLDQKIASDLEEAENLDRLRLLQDLEQNDLIVARRIAEELQWSSGPVYHLEDGDDGVEDVDIEDEDDDRGAAAEIAPPLSGGLQRPVLMRDFVDLTVSSSDKSDAEAGDSAPMPLPARPLQAAASASSSSRSGAASSSSSSLQSSLGTKRRRPANANANTKKAAGRSSRPSSLRRFFLATPAASVSSSSSSASPSPIPTPLPSQPLSQEQEAEAGVEAEAEAAWQCGRCTFRNSALLTCCEMCDRDRDDLT